MLHERFLDPATGALRDRPLDEAADAAPLERAYFPISDAPAPSGNGAAALGLLRLHALTGNERAHDDALSILRAFAGSAGQLGSSAATWMKAAAWTLRPVTTVVVVEEPEGPLLNAALHTYHPRMVVRRLDPGAADRHALPPELAAMVSGEAPRGYVCSGSTCAAPATDAVTLIERIHAFHG